MKKRLAFLIPIYIIIVCAITGCSVTYDYEGKSDIEKARSLHTALDSATITVVDIQNEVAQRIEYKYVGDVMTYMYMGSADGVTYYEFNNGTELNKITLPEETEWTGIAKGSEEYYSYSKTAPHYFANGEQLFATYPSAIEKVTVENDDELNKIIYTYEYDEAELKKLSGFSSLGDISDFIMRYVLNDEGYITTIVNSYTVDGVAYSYHTEITDMNSHEKIERTVIDTE